MIGCALSYPITKYKKEITYKVENSYCMGNFFGGNSVLENHCKHGDLLLLIQIKKFLEGIRSSKDVKLVTTFLLIHTLD